MKAVNKVPGINDAATKEELRRIVEELKIKGEEQASVQEKMDNVKPMAS